MTFSHYVTASIYNGSPEARCLFYGSWSIVRLICLLTDNM
jgi:hypothetical protein